uniref:Mediator complex subunit 27 n=1 Tax=Neolamprologus brichardi TaxID=32507 RepID=A0A3Q4I9P4_NEOBR
MADVVNVGVNLDAFSHAISGIQALRSSVSRVFEFLKDGMKNRETLEGREKQFISEFQENLEAVNRDLNTTNQLKNHPLQNDECLNPACDRLHTPWDTNLLCRFYRRCLDFCRLQYHASLASSLLNQQSLKRSANQMGASAKRRPKVQPSTLVLPPQYVDDVISRIGRLFPDMTIELFRPNGTSAVLLVTLGKVLKAIVRDHASNHAPSGPHLYRFPQFCKLSFSFTCSSPFQFCIFFTSVQYVGICQPVAPSKPSPNRSSAHVQASPLPTKTLSNIK